jgi:hypothetical protein
MGEGALFQGRLALYRMTAADVDFYFLGRGTFLRVGRVGCLASSPVSLYLDGTRGRISADRETAITVYQPGITGVRCDGKELEVVDTGPESVRVSVPEGQNRRIQLITGNSRSAD